PQGPFPYQQLVEETARRGRSEMEVELLDTGAFDEDRYFDVFVEYAKADTDDILIRISIVNRAKESAKLDVLPTLWFRNTWAWGSDERRPRLRRDEHTDSFAPHASVIRARHFDLPLRYLICENVPELLFTENETNVQRLYGGDNEAA